MPVFDPVAYATRLLAARQVGGTPLVTPEVVPATADDAYAVQDHVTARLGPAAAWKVGAPNPTAEPTCAPILSQGFNTSDGRTFRAGAQMGVELEVAFRLGADFPAATSAPSADAVRRAIEGAYIAIETCIPRHADGLKAPPLCTLADNGINHGLILGPRIADWAAIDAKALKARVDINGVKVVETTGGHSHGGIFDLLVWQVGHCVTRRGGLTRGTVITTGSWMGIVWAEIPARVVGAFEGVGAMSLQLAGDTSDDPAVKN